MVPANLRKQLCSDGMLAIHLLILAALSFCLHVCYCQAAVSPSLVQRLAVLSFDMYSEREMGAHPRINSSDIALQQTESKLKLVAKRLNDKAAEQFRVWVERSSTDDNVLYVAFRGTSNVDNVLSNLQFRQVLLDVRTYSVIDVSNVGMKRIATTGNDDLVYVHRGFALAYASLRAELHMALSKLLRRRSYIVRSHHIVVTGHSLGGALATLAALDLSLNLPQEIISDVSVSCCTFGSPQVGGERFHRIFDANVSNCSRVITPQDPVPHALTGAGFALNLAKRLPRLAKCLDNDAVTDRYQHAPSTAVILGGCVSERLQQHAEILVDGFISKKASGWLGAISSVGVAAVDQHHQDSYMRGIKQLIMEKGNATRSNVSITKKRQSIISKSR